MGETLRRQLSELQARESQLQNALALISEADLQDAEAALMAELRANKYELSIISKAIAFYDKLNKQVAS